MPSLAELTDYSPQQGTTPTALPVESVVPNADGVRRVVINTPAKAAPDGGSVGTDGVSPVSSTVNSVLNALLRDDDKRYQLWPEKVVREALSAAHDAYNEGTVPPGLRREDYTDIPSPTMPTPDSTTLGRILNIAPVASSPADNIIGQGQAMSALAGTGGLAGADASLGSTAFLRPALKFENKIYKAPVGGQHLDALPEHLYNDFQTKAMNGEDINHYNFGFMNHKGQFLDREKALDYAIKEGLVDQSAGQYGALTSTLMADSSKPGTAIEAMAKTAQPFYSALEHNVNNISQAKMTGDQWLGTLSNKPGVKPEELQWTGVGDFLKERSNQPVTKAELQEHLANNKVELKEVDRGNNEVDILAKQLGEKENGIGSWDRIGGGGQEHYYRDAEKQLKQNRLLSTKYHSYQLPGGENYREKLLTLPSEMSKYNEFIKDLRSKYGEGGLANKPLTEVERAKLDKLQETAGDNGQANYKSSHWDEPNILAHVRMNDRTIDGKKSLHIEEIQSDWHQQGRDRGYKQELTKNENDELNKLEARNIEIKNFMSSGKNISLEESQALVKEHRDLLDKLTPLRSKKLDHGVPDAPFKKNWHELALKRMIREAAEKGYDRLSWTPGEAQAARYDLSKSIDRVQYHNDKQRLVAFDKNGSVKMDESVAPEKVSDYVGKDVAEKLFKTPKQLGTIHTLENADLKIGGEGMKGFYDQIIPKALSKITGEQVKQGNLPSERMSVQPGYKEKSWDVVSQDGTGIKKFDTKAEAEQYVKERGPKIHYIDIPKSLKDKAMGTGFPLFSSTHIFTPVAGNPFQSDKKK